MIFIQVYTHIFVSPSAATGAKASLKQGNAKIHGMQKVIPSTICYAAIQVRTSHQLYYRNLNIPALQAYVALSSAAEWKEEWEGINLPRLYILLREQFAYPDDPWYSDTLQWWNKQTFEKSCGTDEDVPETAQDAEGPSTRERGDAERQQRIRAAAGN